VLQPLPPSPPWPQLRAIMTNPPINAKATIIDSRSTLYLYHRGYVKNVGHSAKTISRRIGWRRAGLISEFGADLVKAVGDGQESVENLGIKALAPVFAQAAEGAVHGEAHASAALEYLLMAASVGVALCGILLAWYLYRVRTEVPGEIAGRVPGLYDLVLNKYYVDEIYDVAIVQRIVNGSVWLWEAFDDIFIDGIVNGVGELVRGAGGGLRRLQTGFVGNYAFSVLLGAVVLLGILFWS